MTRYPIFTRAFALGLVACAACAADIDDPGVKTGDVVDEGEGAQRVEPLITSVEDAEGSSVTWYEAAHAGDEPTMVLRGVYPAPPMVHPAFLERHGALEVFLAVADLDAPIPAALRASGARGGALSATTEITRQDRERLREANQALLREWSFEAPADDAADKATCTNAQKTWIQGIYGKGYGDTETCGTSPNGFFSTVGHYNYCNTPGGDCDYPIGNLGACFGPTADPVCSFFQGQLQAQRGRTHATGGFDPEYNMTGHRTRFLAYNCGASAGSVLMRWRRGAGPLTDIWLAPFHYDIEIFGTSFFPAVADVISNVSNANWVEHIGQSGSTFQMNELRLYTDAAEAGFACADVTKEFDMVDMTYSGCNEVDGATIPFCDDNSCNGCWD